MQENGVIAMVYYPLSLHLQPIYQHLGLAIGQFPAAERASHEVLSLSMFPEITPEQQEQVVYTLKDCLM
jgi:dTDP-4-amino-4,6-dideoxygalactose transaminase